MACHTENLNAISVALDEAAHYEPPHLELHHLQIQLVPFWALIVTYLFSPILGMERNSLTEPPTTGLHD